MPRINKLPVFVSGRERAFTTNEVRNEWSRRRKVPTDSKTSHGFGSEPPSGSVGRFTIRGKDLQKHIQGACVDFKITDTPYLEKNGTDHVAHRATATNSRKPNEEKKLEMILSPMILSKNAHEQRKSSNPWKKRVHHERHETNRIRFFLGFVFFVSPLRASRLCVL